jgi:two-component system, chemotaxis family, chemotaxis protein CheY
LSTKSRQIATVVEDVEWIRRSMGRILRGLGYRVVEVSDAAEAVEAAGAEPPDIIVTDEELPTLGELMECVRGTGALRGVPVAIINPDEEEGTRLGDIVVLPDFDLIATLLNGTSR